VSDVEVKRTESLTRQQAAERLSAMATALADGGHVEVQLGASTLKLHVPTMSAARSRWRSTATRSSWSWS